MFKSMTSTDEWELNPDKVVNVGSIDLHEIVESPLSDFYGNGTYITEKQYNDLLEDSNILYALRKLGMVSAGQEAAAIEFLKGEGIE